LEAGVSLYHPRADFSATKYSAENYEQRLTKNVNPTALLTICAALLLDIAQKTQALTCFLTNEPAKITGTEAAATPARTVRLFFTF
jgi:hypothetical protein